jgi:hypothetical protein
MSRPSGPGARCFRVVFMANLRFRRGRVPRRREKKIRRRRRLVRGCALRDADATEGGGSPPSSRRRRTKVFPAPRRPAVFRMGRRSTRRWSREVFRLVRGSSGAGNDCLRLHVNRSRSGRAGHHHRCAIARLAATASRGRTVGRAAPVLRTARGAGRYNRAKRQKQQTFHVRHSWLNSPAASRAIV